MLKTAAMRARMRSGSRKMTEVIRELRCNGMNGGWIYVGGEGKRVGCTEVMSQSRCKMESMESMMTCIQKDSMSVIGDTDLTPVRYFTY